MPLAKAMMEAAGNSTQPTYIEDVFSTSLYTGNGSTQTITNGIDLAGKGGLVWTKRRNAAGYGNYFIDTVRGATNAIESNSIAAQTSYSDSVTAFGSSGYSLGADTLNGGFNNGAGTYVGWAFREQPKFFDIVTYTGTGANTTIAHNLGSVPGCIMVKRTDSTGNWQVYHQSLANTEYMVLNSTAAKATGATRWNSTTPTSTVFSLGTDATVNANGATYVAYLFAHNAGGFGLTGTDNVISCGSVAATGGVNNVVNLGYEPQLVIIKSATVANNWHIIDNMRGFTANNGVAHLFPNSSTTESTTTVQDVGLTATGFTIDPNLNGFNGTGTYIYIAIRRGPMKTPTSGTSVFNAIARTGTGANATVTNSSFTPDIVVPSDRAGTYPTAFTDRLRGQGVAGAMNLLRTSQTSAESYDSGIAGLDVMNGFLVGAGNYGNGAGRNYVNWLFRRAPGFFDEVCYTGNGAASRAVPHNLTVAPELIIVKARNLTQNWFVYNGAKPTFYLTLDTTNSESNSFNIWGGTATATNFYVNNVGSSVNDSGYNFVAYLFATCPGVSKVFNFTGNGSSQTINCGFTGGARFVMIKRTDSTGDWYVWDSARGIVSGNDPRLSLNTTAAEVTTDDSVDTDSTGFVVNQLSATNVNVNGASYIGLAIA